MIRRGTSARAGGRLVLALALGAAGAAFAASPPRTSRLNATVPPPRAEIAGTVFDEDGFTVKGCEVTVTNPVTKKHWDGETNPMGEFEIWVPAGKADYLVRASAPHLQPDQAQVHVENSEKTNIFLHLKKAPGTGGGAPAAGAGKRS